jgi:hypothetical protein
MAGEISDEFLRNMPVVGDGPPGWLQVHGANVSNRVRGRLVLQTHTKSASATCWTMRECSTPGELA